MKTIIIFTSTLIMQFNSMGQCDMKALRSRDASWSPDGNQIAFSSNESGIQEIFVMNSDGSAKKQLTNSEHPNYYPFFSPDGNSIVTRLTYNEYSDQTPSFSPDGSKIAFVSSRDGNAEIYVMNADGTDQRRLTNDPRSDRVPAWSPDSKKIVYYSREPTSVAGSGSLSWMGSEIYEVSLSGERKQLTHNNHLDQGPVYSPNGKKILLTSCSSGSREVFVMNVETGETKQLTFTKK